MIRGKDRRMEERRPLDRPYWIYLAWDRDQRRAVLNTIMNLGQSKT
jgi:hypothetical protein